MKEDNEDARNQAKEQIESIMEMVAALDTENDDEREEAIQTINEDPLEVSVRSGWHTLGQKAGNEEYLILLCTGGPAVRIVGELDDYDQPDTAHVEYQDWFTPWERYDMNEEETQAVLTYAQQFYYSED